MPFDLARIRNEISRAPVLGDAALEVALAAVSDLFRLAGRPAPSDAFWRAFAKHAKALGREQISALAHFLGYSSLRAASIEALGQGKQAPEKLLKDFFAAIEPLTGEMLRQNQFRQEEFLRRWISCLEGEIAGETKAQSAQRLDALDYRATRREYERAEAARKAEAERRAKLAAEAAARAAASNPWQE